MRINNIYLLLKIKNEMMYFVIFLVYWNYTNISLRQVIYLHFRIWLVRLIWNNWASNDMGSNSMMQLNNDGFVGTNFLCFNDLQLLSQTDTSHPLLDAWHYFLLSSSTSVFLFLSVLSVSILSFLYLLHPHFYSFGFLWWFVYSYSTLCEFFTF